MSCGTNGEWDQQPKLDRIALIRQRVENLAAKLRSDHTPFKSDISQISKADESYIFPSSDVSFIKRPKCSSDLEENLCFCNECKYTRDQEFSISDDLVDGEMRIRTPPKQHVLSPTPKLHDSDLTLKPNEIISPRFVDVTYTYPPSVGDPKVKQFLLDLKLDSFINLFTENEICYEDLFLLSREDLAELKIPIGPRNRILNSLGKLQGINLDVSSSQLFSTLAKPSSDLDSSAIQTFNPFHTFDNLDCSPKEMPTPKKPPRVNSSRYSSVRKASPMIDKSMDISPERFMQIQSPQNRRAAPSLSPVKCSSRNKLKDEVNKFMQEISNMNRRTGRRRVMNTSILQDSHTLTTDTSFNASSKGIEISNILKDVNSQQSELVKMINQSQKALTLFPDREPRSLSKPQTPMSGRKGLPSNRLASPSVRMV
jgi:hypothetical protein